ncbi:MAG TPA: MFS transporter [Acidimicrobiia bacterium]|nr:MFS transporter [Acidimicrobiia bacterium]
MPERERLLTPRFLLVVASGLSYFMAIGMLIPVVPQYVKGPLAGGNVGVGVAVGALFVGAILLRPYAGRVGDRFGRRVLIIAGALIVAVTTAFYGAIDALPFLVLMRIASGVGEAAFFVGAATMITDLAPEHRRGEAVSYWSVAVYGGLAFGPALGEAVLGDDRFVAAWIVSASLALLAAVLGTVTVDVVRAVPQRPPGKLLHRAAIAPGSVLFLGLIGLAGFTAFVPLYVRDLGLGGADGLFLLYGGLILCVRIFGARLPDVLGGRVAATIALSCGAVGLTLMAGWPTVAGLVAGTAVFAAGMSLLYPALMLLAITAVPDHERGSVVGTFSSFFDLSQGLGALILGGVAAASGYRGAFAGGAVAAVIGVVLLQLGIGLKARGRVPAATAERVPA